MTKHMLIDATHDEETRVVVMNGKRIEEYDVETSSRRQLKGNIYLAKIIRIEPSLQAAFVDYGGNRHGFLAFSEIHPDYFQIPAKDREQLLALQEEEYLAEQQKARQHASNTSENDLEDIEDDADNFSQEEEQATPQHAAHFLKNYRIQEVVRRRQIILVQIVKEERGNKGAALTTYISMAGRYCVLMPNALRNGGVSRKITSESDRRRLRDIIQNLELPRSMSMIIRTAGAGRPGPEIVKDCDYLLQLWEDIRTLALNSIAPQLVYEEANLIKRSLRDLFTRDIEDVIIDGETAWKHAREFARQLMPQNTHKIKAWQNRGHSLFSHYNVESHLTAMFSPIVRLESGGYIVINQTEALVAVDVNSGKSTSQRNIEETALRTNLEAADEVARQLRLRDLAGLIVIDFIDMESNRHNHKVEKRLKDALRIDRARIQVGRISHFGLLEMSRQRLRPSLAETMLSPCPHCQGTGTVRGIESTALHVLRVIEEEASRNRHSEIKASIASNIVLYMLNHKRENLAEIEARHRVHLIFENDENLIGGNVKIECGTPSEHIMLAYEKELHEDNFTSVESNHHKVEVPPITATYDAPKSYEIKETLQKIEPVLPVKEVLTPPSDEPSETDEKIEENMIEDTISHTSPNPNNTENNTRSHRDYGYRRGGHYTRRRRRRMPQNQNNQHHDQHQYLQNAEQTGEGKKYSESHISSTKKQYQPLTEQDSLAPSAYSAPAIEDDALMPGKKRTRTKRKTSDNVEKPVRSSQYDAPYSGDEQVLYNKTNTLPYRPYQGPTPADPFAGYNNIFEVIEDEAHHASSKRHFQDENQAVPQPINIDDTKPKKRRSGWWNR